MEEKEYKKFRREIGKRRAARIAAFVYLTLAVIFTIVVDILSYFDIPIQERECCLVFEPLIRWVGYGFWLLNGLFLGGVRMCIKGNMQGLGWIALTVLVVSGLFALCCFSKKKNWCMTVLLIVFFLEILLWLPKAAGIFVYRSFLEIIIAVVRISFFALLCFGDAAGNRLKRCFPKEPYMTYEILDFYCKGERSEEFFKPDMW